ncbi:MAG: Uma2 family endonuclease [Planctomycetia bacterium]|nr:Uma2 family endonuclease [Planctomycetia bacterium]
MSTATATPPAQPQPQPTTARMTAEEFGLKYSGEHVEYINGEVKEIPMPGGKHGTVCNWASFYLTQHVVAKDLGRVFSNDTFVKVPTPDDPERVYGADVCFVSYTRLAKDAEISEGVLPVSPNLVIEVRSPSDTWAKVFRKLGEYLDVGVEAVMVLDPNTRTASVYRNDIANPQQIFNFGDTFTVPDVLPGFSVPVASLFA